MNLRDYTNDYDESTNKVSGYLDLRGMAIKNKTHYKTLQNRKN